MPDLTRKTVATLKIIAVDPHILGFSGRGFPGGGGAI